MSDEDLFGFTPPQADLFADTPAQPRKVFDFPDEARRRLMKVLAEARAATTLPWSERETGKWEILFPQMAQWLPDDEASQLCFEFAEHIERLRHAA
jgi:hypothetical protein